MPQMNRRHLLALSATLAALAGTPLPAAVAPAEAETMIQSVADEVTALIRSGASPQEQAQRFRKIFESTAATPQIARFVMGRSWREMSPAQQDAFRDAFLDYVARVYVGILGDYRGQTLTVTGSRDFGDKGILVYSVAKAEGTKDTPVEWLVSDRAGDGAKLVDLTVEGVSMLQSQRQEFAAMLEKRNGDVDQLIADLRSGKATGKEKS